MTSPLRRIILLAACIVVVLSSIVEGRKSRPRAAELRRRSRDMLAPRLDALPLSAGASFANAIVVPSISLHLRVPPYYRKADKKKNKAKRQNFYKSKLSGAGGFQLGMQSDSEQVGLIFFKKKFCPR